MKKIIPPLFFLIITLSFFVCGSAVATDSIQDNPTEIVSSHSGILTINTIILLGLLGVFSWILWRIKDSEPLPVVLACGCFLLIFAFASYILLG